MKGRIYDKLCAIDDVGRASALEEEPTVVCTECAAKAHDPMCLCEPVDLKETKATGLPNRDPNREFDLE